MEARDVRRLSLAWIGALVVLAAMAGGGCWLSIRSLRESDDSRLLLAIGRQHMLSQRVALLAQQYVAAEDEYTRLDLRWELRACADELLRIVDRHLQPERAGEAGGAELDDEPPLSQRPLSAAVMAMYNAPPSLLTYHVTELSDSVQQLCASETDLTREPALAGVVQSRAHALLPSLDLLIEQLQQEHAAGIEKHVSLQLRLFASTLAALLAAGILLAVPGLQPERARPAKARRPAAERANVRRPANPTLASTSGPRSTSDAKIGSSS